MKKVLLTTTALTLIAGAAAAEVSLSGAARFGFQYNSGATGTTPKTTLEKRTTINIDASTSTDSGLALGARVRIRSDEVTGSAVNGSVVYAKQGNMKVSVGNVAGALGVMPGLFGGSVGLNGNGYHNVVTNTVTAGYWGWTSYSSRGNGANGVQVDYSMGNVNLAVSYAALNDATTAANMLGAMVSFSTGGWTIAAGTQQSSAAGGVGDKTVLTVGGKLGNVGVGLAYASNNGTTKTAVNASYNTGAMTISGFIANDSSAGANVASGLNVSYDLGGAAIVVGITRTPMATTVASGGVKFGF